MLTVFTLKKERYRINFLSSFSLKNRLNMGSIRVRRKIWIIEVIVIWILSFYILHNVNRESCFHFNSYTKKTLFCNIPKQFLVALSKCRALFQSISFDESNHTHHQCSYRLYRESSSFWWWCQTKRQDHRRDCCHLNSHFFEEILHPRECYLKTSLYKFFFFQIYMPFRSILSLRFLS